MDMKIFYDELRADPAVFGNSLSQTQVDGINTVLRVMAGQPVSWVAYALATAYGESSMTMQPVEENLSYSAKRIPEVFSPERLKGLPPSDLAHNPQLLANTVYDVSWLGNTEPGDGWRFRGRGIVQLTGRINYQRMGDDLDVDLVADPDLAMDPVVSALALAAGIVDGLFTGKSVDRYLPSKNVEAGYHMFHSARRVINGTFQADRYAKWAMAFQSALVAAGYEPVPAPAADQAVGPDPDPAADQAVGPDPAPAADQAVGPDPDPEVEPAAEDPMEALLSDLRKLLTKYGGI